MVALPADTPVTVPPLFIVAMLVLLLLQVPPAVSFASVVLLPSQTAIVPVIAPGNGSTVILDVVEQPPLVYVIVVEPIAIPVTTPLDASIVATEVVLLAHVPPVETLLSVTVDPRQTLLPPVMAGGMVTMVAVVVM